MNRLIFDIALPIWQSAYETKQAAHPHPQAARRWLVDTLFASRSTLALGCAFTKVLRCGD